MTRLQIRLFGPYFSSFSTNSYSYYYQMSQNLVSNFRIFASARIARQPPSYLICCSYSSTNFWYFVLSPGIFASATSYAVSMPPRTSSGSIRSASG